MDVILLYHNARGVLYAPGRRQHLEALFDWIETNGVGGANDLYSVLPPEGEDRNACLECLQQWAANGTINVHLVLSQAQVSGPLLERVEVAGLRHILVAAAGESMQPIVETISEYLLANPTSRLEFGFWLNPPDDTSSCTDIRRLVELGIPADVIDTPLFTTAASTPAPLEYPFPSVIGNPLCQLFVNAITVDSMGHVRFCPRQSDDGTTLGNLFTDSPQQILCLKGHHSHQAGTMPMCCNCELRGRFFWPDRLSRSMEKLYRIGISWRGVWPPVRLSEVPQFDFGAMPRERQEQELDRFEERIRHWRERGEGEIGRMSVSVEVPVFKGGWLMPCIESVLYQTSPDWILSLLWDGGDELSRRILERVAAMGHPRIRIYFQENRGIARSRRFLTEHTCGEFILALDDDDMLASDAVEKFLSFARERPWCGIVRARRAFIDELGELVEMAPWFPFEPRHYEHGMVTDLFNHTQPYMIRRAAYDRTSGWEGFEDFHFAGEDCDIFTKIEEVGSIDLLDEVLYYYRLNAQRTSHLLKPEGAYEMWRRLADKTIARIGLPVKRINEFQPFRYERTTPPPPKKNEIDFVIPFYESDEEELAYAHSRPPSTFQPVMFQLDGWKALHQPLDPPLSAARRIVITCSSVGSVYGSLQVGFHDGLSSGHPFASGMYRLEGETLTLRDLSIEIEGPEPWTPRELWLTLAFVPDRRNYGYLKILQLPSTTGSNGAHIMLRLFREHRGYAAAHLRRCLESLRRCGICDEAIHIVERRQSSAANRNEGFRQCVRPYICYLDDDVEMLSQDTFDDLLKELHACSADLVGPKIVTPQGTIFSANPGFNQWQRPVPHGLGEPDRGQYDYRAETLWLPSTALLVRREVVRAVGGFDEGYVGSQMEDVDFCFKARLRGFRCLYSGGVKVVHYNHQRNHSFPANFGRFYNRWKQYPSLFESQAAGKVGS